jgi:hypothetical protein
MEPVCPEIELPPFGSNLQPFRNHFTTFGGAPRICIKAAAFAARLFRRRPVGLGFWRSQMAVSSKSLSPTRSENLDDIETLQTLVIFSGAGLLLSLLLAMNGWI